MLYQRLKDDDDLTARDEACQRVTSYNLTEGKAMKPASHRSRHFSPSAHLTPAETILSILAQRSRDYLPGIAYQDAQYKTLVAAAKIGCSLQSILTSLNETTAADVPLLQRLSNDTDACKNEIIAKLTQEYAIYRRNRLAQAKTLDQLALYTDEIHHRAHNPSFVTPEDEAHLQGLVNKYVFDLKGGIDDGRLVSVLPLGTGLKFVAEIREFLAHEAVEKLQASAIAAETSSALNLFR